METRFTRFKIEIQVRDNDGIGDGRRGKGKGVYSKISGGTNCLDLFYSL